jgi:hypothetical protein
VYGLDPSGSVVEMQVISFWAKSSLHLEGGGRKGLLHQHILIAPKNGIHTNVAQT